MPRRDPGPSVKDKEMYEALRDDGASKEKAARIANAAARTSRSEVGRKGAKAGDYDEWSKDQLMGRARESAPDDHHACHRLHLSISVRSSVAHSKSERASIVDAELSR